MASDKRQDIMLAARELFLRQGLRATSMEAIAHHAQVAKPTLYKYFADKQAVFAAIIDQVMDEIRRQVARAFEADSAVSQKVAAALSAKHKAVFRLLECSPHAEELYLAPQTASREGLEALDREMRDQIIAAFATEGRDDGVLLAPILMAAADGVARHAQNAAEIGPAIRFVVDRLSTQN